VYRWLLIEAEEIMSFPYFLPRKACVPLLRRRCNVISFFLSLQVEEVLVET